jgi:hypothetical protein
VRGQPTPVRPAGTAGSDLQLQQSIAQGRGSVEIVEVQDAVESPPGLDEVDDRVVKDVLRGVVPSLPSEDPEVEAVAVGGDGVDLVADGLRLPFDDGDPQGAALEADHGLVDGK